MSFALSRVFRRANPVACAVLQSYSRRYFIIQYFKIYLDSFCMFSPAVWYTLSHLETNLKNAWVHNWARDAWRAGFEGSGITPLLLCCCNLSAKFDLLCQIGQNINSLLLNWWQLKHCWMMNQLSSCRKELKSHIELIYKEIAVYLLSVQLICHF